MVGVGGGCQFSKKLNKNMIFCRILNPRKRIKSTCKELVSNFSFFYCQSFTQKLELGLKLCRNFMKRSSDYFQEKNVCEDSYEKAKSFIVPIMIIINLGTYIQQMSRTRHRLSFPG